MKKNKLTLSAGILLVIAASICVISSIICLYSLGATILEISLSEEYSLVNYIILIAVIALLISLLFKIAQVIVFMILGIKLIKNGKKGKSVNEYRGLIITTMILAYISALFGNSDITGFFEFGLFLTAGILLSCALSMKDEALVQETPQAEVKKEETQKEEDSMAKQINALQELKDNGVIGNKEYLDKLQKIIGIEKKQVEKKNSVTSDGKEDNSESEGRE